MKYEPMKDHAERKRISALIERCEKEQKMDDLIKRQDAIDAIECITWYHQNRNNDMVSGANSDEHQAWYKSQDIYEALENIPSAERQHGYWIKLGPAEYRCFECGKIQYADDVNELNFCCCCGSHNKVLKKGVSNGI